MDSDQPSPQEQDQKPTPSNSAPGVALRIILTLVVGTVVGAVLYFSAAGWIPYLEQRVLQPIAENQSGIDHLARTQAALEQEVAALSTAGSEGEIEQLSATLITLEQDSAELAGQIAALETSLQANLNLSATYLPSRLATLEARQAADSRNLSALATAQMGAAPRASDIILLHILDLLSRANQSLLHDNYGLAEEQLEGARDYLEQLDLTTPGTQPDLIPALLVEVNGAIADLPAEPNLAALKIELAWQLAAGGLQAGRDPGAVTPTPFAPAPEIGTPSPTPN